MVSITSRIAARSANRIAVTVVALACTLTASIAVAQTRIKLGYTAISDFSAAFVAKEEGYFKNNGLDVELQLLTLTSVVPAALQSNAIQVGGTVPTVLLQAVDSGLDMVGLANATINDNSGKNPALMVRAGSGIKQAGDLVGKKVGVPGLGGVMHVLVRRWLSEKGVDYKKVTFIEIQLPQMNDLLKSGTVDALALVEPFTTRVEATGTGTVISYMGRDFPSGFSNVLYMSTREWADKNPAAIKALRLSLAQANSLVEQNPAKARAYIGKYIKLPPEALALIPVPKLNAELTAPRLRFWAESMRQQGMLRNDANLSALIAR